MEVGATDLAKKLIAREKNDERQVREWDECVNISYLSLISDWMSSQIGSSGRSISTSRYSTTTKINSYGITTSNENIIEESIRIGSTEDSSCE